MRPKGNAFLLKGFSLFRRCFAVYAAFLRVALVYLAGFIRKLVTNVVGIRLHVAPEHVQRLAHLSCRRHLARRRRGHRRFRLASPCTPSADVFFCDPVIAGAIGAFCTATSPQVVQPTNPAPICSSQLVLLPNHASKR